MREKTITTSNGIQQSIYRRRNRFDNTPKKKFIGLLKQEIFYNIAFKSIEELISKIFKNTYWYNNDKNKTRIGVTSSVKFGAN